ncbi:MAG: hypothetical protein HQL50_10185 [Magnetococcales bacterium]|nr:hypothetical protein [Magnetococcales bacterium]
MFAVIRVLLLAAFGGASFGIGMKLAGTGRPTSLTPVTDGEAESPGHDPRETVRFLGQTLFEESEEVISHEEIPLDNRKGTTPLNSEHTLSRTVETTLELEKEEDLEKKLGMGLIKLVEGEFKRQISNELGLRLDSTISKKVTLRCSARPGELARFRVVWQQSLRRGLYSVTIGEEIHRIPFQATCGLSYTVESLGDGSDTDETTATEPLQDFV